MSTKQQNNEEEEVDLGSIFIIIGKGFKNFFNFILSIFKEIFHFLISILIFLKTHFIKFIIAALIGGIIGAFLEYKSLDKYGSNLLVQPNFKSSRQLYNNIKFYDDLVKQEKTELLAAIFKIDSTKAASLKKFTISPVYNNNDIINAYDRFILSVDTLTVKSYTFEEFEQSFTDFDYRVHDIQVESTRNDIFKDLEDVIIGSIVNNDYFNRIKTLTNENLKRTDFLLKKNLKEVDSLRRVYMKVMLEEAKKNSNGTSIDLGGTKNSTKEIQLFETDRKINEELKQTTVLLSEKSKIINIISNFQTVGYEIKGVTKNFISLLAGVSVLFVLFFILILDLNKFLINYKK